MFFKGPYISGKNAENPHKNISNIDIMGMFFSLVLVTKLSFNFVVFLMILDTQLVLKNSITLRATCK